MPRPAAAHGVVGVVVATMAAASLCEAQQPTIEDVVERLDTYIVEYETRVSELVADERYEQWVKRKSGYGGSVVGRRKLTSTFFLVRLPDGQAWFGFRDVSSVDGKRLSPRERTIEQILGEQTSDAFEEAFRISRENAKYNIGPIYRTVNVPLQALELLHPRNRHRLQFSSTVRERMAGRLAWRIDFAEHTPPSIIADGSVGDSLSRVGVWVDPRTGEILKTELRIGGTETSLFDALVSVEFRVDNRLKVLLPSRMEETYTLQIEVLHGRANYGNYRRFETSARLVDPPN